MATPSENIATLKSIKAAIKSALSSILGVGAVTNDMGTYSSKIATIGNQLEGMLTLNRVFSIDLTGSGLTSLRSYLFAQTKITDIVIPNTIETINSAAIYQCKNITTLTLPNSVTSVAASAFNGCTRLESITFLATTPPTLANSNAFSNTNGCPIYVPAASVDTYKAASNWVDLADRIEAIPE